MAVAKGSPWSHLRRRLTNEEWGALKEWRKANDALVFRCGETRTDGRLFLKYNQANCGGEKWATEDSFLKVKAARKTEGRNAYHRVWRKKKYLNDQEYRDGVRAKSKAWYAANKDRANEVKKLWWRKRYSSDPVFRRKSLDKAAARTKKFGCYCVRDALRRVKEVTGSQALIRRAYKHAALARKRNGIKVEIDHIIPIAHGGAHHELNLQILPEDMNRAKKDSPFWMHDGCYLDWRDVPRFLWPEHLRPEYERLIVLHPKPVHAIRVPFGTTIQLAART